jgi:hypothetical protein
LNTGAQKSVRHGSFNIIGATGDPWGEQLIASGGDRNIVLDSDAYRLLGQINAGLDSDHCTNFERRVGRCVVRLKTKVMTHAMDECIAKTCVHNHLSTSGINVSECCSGLHGADSGGLGAEH